MAKIEIEVERKEFKEFYEMVELCNKGILIDNVAVLFKSKMSYGISRNLRDLKNLYLTDSDHSNKILVDYYNELKTLREKYCIKTATGIYMPIKEKEKELESFFNMLKDKYKEQISENNKFLEEKEKISIYTVDNENFTTLPQDIADKLFLMRSE